MADKTKTETPEEPSIFLSPTGGPVCWTPSFIALSESQTAGSIVVMTSRGDVFTAPPPAYTSLEWQRGGPGGADERERMEKRLKELQGE